MTVHEHTQVAAFLLAFVGPGILGMVLLGVWDLARVRR